MPLARRSCLAVNGAETLVPRSNLTGPTCTEKPFIQDPTSGSKRPYTLISIKPLRQTRLHSHIVSHTNICDLLSNTNKQTNKQTRRAGALRLRIQLPNHSGVAFRLPQKRHFTCPDYIRS